MTGERHNSAEEIEKAKNGDEKTLEKVICSNMGLVKSIASRFERADLEREDLIQIGVVGMIKAVRNFDPSFGCAFSTYAVPMIAGEIKRFLRDDGMIKVSRVIKRNAAEISRFRNDFAARTGREPDIAEISEGTGITREDAVVAMEAAMPVISMSEPDEDETNEFFSEENVGEDETEEIFDRIALRDAVSRLSDDEKTLIKLRYFHGLTQKRTAQILKRNQVFVSREEKKIMEKLRSFMT